MDNSIKMVIRNSCVRELLNLKNELVIRILSAFTVYFLEFTFCIVLYFC